MEKVWVWVVVLVEGLWFEVGFRGAFRVQV